jgi:hypothetical protein
VTQTVDPINGLARDLANYKRLSTGLRLKEFNGPADLSRFSFDDLVTYVYGWYVEELGEDCDFLLAHATGNERRRLSAFRRVIRDQRHDKQHLNYDRSSEARAWIERALARATSGQDRDAVLKAALLTELADALRALCDIAARVVRTPAMTRDWRERAASDPESEILAVYQNLGMSHPRDVGYVQRQYMGKPQRRHAQTASARAQIAEAIVMGNLAEPLSIEYTRLLDEFGLIGDSAAQSFLLLAHGVEMSGHTNQSTVSALEQIWPIVNQGS